MASDLDEPAAAGRRAQLKRWLDTWSEVGPMLEQERWARLRAMTSRESDRDVRLVLELWQPDWIGDNGEELLRHQAVFAKARRARRA